MSSLGRNEPCHCGSGKKYKKCCLELDQQRQRPQPAAIAQPIAGVPNQPNSAPQAPSTQQPTVENVKAAVSNQIAWSSDAYRDIALQMVEALFPQYEAIRVLEAASFWHQYSSAVQPVVRKVDIVCAALEYFISEAYHLEITQNELAEKYGVSAASISKRFQEMLDFAEQSDLGTEQNSEE